MGGIGLGLGLEKMKFLLSLRKLKSHRPTLPTRHVSRPQKQSRCLLLGSPCSGKSTFLLRVKTGTFVDASEASGFSGLEFNVEELLISKRHNTTLTLLDPPGSDRRSTRLYFSHSAPGTKLSILLFLDCTQESDVPGALEELLYTLTYARSRGCVVTWLGVVINKQDLLLAPQLGQLPVRATSRFPRRTLTGFSLRPDKRCELEEKGREKERKERGGGREREVVLRSIKGMVTNVIDAYQETFPKGEELIWKVFDGEDKGLSVKTGDGVREMFEAVVRVGLEKRAGLLDGVGDEEGEKEDEEFIRMLVESVAPTGVADESMDGNVRNGS